MKYLLVAVTVILVSVAFVGHARAAEPVEPIAPVAQPVEDVKDVAVERVDPESPSSCYGIIDRRPSIDSGFVECDGGSGYLQAIGYCTNSAGHLVVRYGNIVYKSWGTSYAIRSSVSCVSRYPTMTALNQRLWGS
jgi:hypothetical protein